MKLKNIFLCIAAVTVSLFAMTACADTMSDSDKALQQQLIGGWVPLEDSYEQVDADGNVIEFSVYEFTESKTKFHDVSSDSVSSSLINEYTITDGKYKVIVDGEAMYAKISFSDEGNLIWYTDDSEDEFRPLTEEEIEEYNIPIGQAIAEEETEESETDDTDGGSDNEQ